MLSQGSFLDTIPAAATAVAATVNSSCLRLLLWLLLLPLFIPAGSVSAAVAHASTAKPLQLSVFQGLISNMPYVSCTRAKRAVTAVMAHHPIINCSCRRFSTLIHSVAPLSSWHPTQPSKGALWGDPAPVLATASLLHCKFALSTGVHGASAMLVLNTLPRVLLLLHTDSRH